MFLEKVKTELAESWDAAFACQRKRRVRDIPNARS